MDRLQYPPPVYPLPPSALGNVSGRQCKGWGDRAIHELPQKINHPEILTKILAGD
ncbi:hypothetical protein [Limnothrix redekei]|uniref:Uncharacterized protein n=1 Tax=Limnothrix redekei LRLZ20PSL1 TaxID=3112953 RepID=A0ABW7CDG1_9CYAN